LFTGDVAAVIVTVSLVSDMLATMVAYKYRCK